MCYLENKSSGKLLDNYVTMSQINAKLSAWIVTAITVCIVYIEVVIQYLNLSYEGQIIKYKQTMISQGLQLSICSQKKCTESTPHHHILVVVIEKIHSFILHKREDMQVYSIIL